MCRRAVKKLLTHSPAVWAQRTLAENWGPCPFRGGEMGPRLTQWRLGRALPLYRVASWSIQPFGHNIHASKIGGSAPFLVKGSGSLSNTMWPGPRATSMPSAILIHPAVWPQKSWVENWGAPPPFWGKLGPHLTQSRLGRGYVHTNWHLNPSSHLATADMGRKLGAVAVCGRGTWVPV